MNTGFTIHKSYILIYFSVLAFFVFTLQNNFSSSHDAITYLHHIVKGEHLFHPHHLLYNASAYVWLKAIGSLFPSLQPHYIIEFLTAIFGSGIILLAYIFFYKRFMLPLSYAALGAVLIAFSYGSWAYSTNVEVYSASIFFSLLLLLWLTRPMQDNYSIYIIAAIHVLAILFHQVNILLYPVVILAIIMQVPQEKRLNRIIIYTLITGLATLAAYLLAARFAENKNTIEEIFSWMLLYARDHDYWRPLSAASPLMAFIGFAHFFIGGHFIFQVPVLDSFITSSLSIHSLSDEKILVASMDQGVAQALLVAAVLVFVFLLASFIITLIYLRRSIRSMPLVHMVIIVPMIIYSIFFIFWMPENLEFWIFQGVLCWILMVSIVSKYSLKPGYLWALPVLLFLVNFFGSMQWLQDKSHDGYRTKVDMVSRILTKHDLVVLEQPWILQDYIRHFTPAGSIDARDPQLLSSAESTLAKGNKIILFEEPGQDIPAVDSLIHRYRERINIASEKEPVIKVIQ